MKTFNGKLSIDFHDNNIAMNGFLIAINHQNVAITKTWFLHTATAGAYKKSRGSSTYTELI